VRSRSSPARFSVIKLLTYDSEIPNFFPISPIAIASDFKPLDFAQQVCRHGKRRAAILPPNSAGQPSSLAHLDYQSPNFLCQPKPYAASILSLTADQIINLATSFFRRTGGSRLRLFQPKFFNACPHQLKFWPCSEISDLIMRMWSIGNICNVVVHAVSSLLCVEPSRRDISQRIKPIRVQIECRSRSPTRRFSPSHINRWQQVNSLGFRHWRRPSAQPR